MNLNDLDHKRVAIWGAGRETTTLLRAIKLRGIHPAVAVFSENAANEGPVGGVTPTSDTAVLREADVVVLSPGVSRYREDVASLSAQLTSATDLFFGEGYEHVIAVTGTKGKSTTSSLIAHLISATGSTVQLAGNIGRSPIDFVNDGEPPHWWVLELSSFQTSSISHSPQIGVFTTLSPEHLDWHGSFEQYRKDKLNLFAHNPQMTSIINVDDPGLVDMANKVPNPIMVSNTPTKASPGAVSTHDGAFYVEGEELFSTDALRLLGRHNQKLACLALTVLQATGVDLIEHRTTIANALFSFEPLAHRLSPVATINDVQYVDDGLATTPIASMAALDAFQERDVTILLGGHDRGASYDQLVDAIAANPRVHAIVMPQNGEMIRDIFQKRHKNALDRISTAQSLDEAVAIAAHITPKGGSVLLSPAAASFGAFRDYVERSEAFCKSVLCLDV